MSHREANRKGDESCLRWSVGARSPVVAMVTRLDFLGEFCNML
jgi:hypothetical protein